MSARWRVATYKSYASLIGENDNLRVEIVPERGSKLVSFLNKRTGREWAYQNDAPWKPLTYGMIFEDGDRSGWDEMFPTILACPCPNEPWQHARFPDHGEVWTLPWQYELTPVGVRLWVQGVQVPYTLMKTMKLSGTELQISYEVYNPTPYPFSYMWCAHNLLKINSGMRWIIEPNLDSVTFQYSHHLRMTTEAYGRTTYPLDTETKLDLSHIEENSGQVAEKYWFEGNLQNGTYGLCDPMTGEQLLYQYQVEDVPYLAIWANYGVFNNDYTAALEPATGYLDDLYVAHLLKKVKTVAGYGRNCWDFTVRIKD